MMKKTIISALLCIILLFSGCTSNLIDSTILGTSKTKEALINNTEYVKEHLLGAWSSSNGEIVEFYSNGIVVNYTPTQQYDYANILDGVMDDDNSYSVESELKSIGYSAYVIPEPDSYTDEELKSYNEYIQSTQNIGISLKYDFWGVIEEKFILHEFQDDDILIVGGNKTLTRIYKDEPSITDNIDGLYINEEDNNLGIRIIETRDGNRGYFDWVEINRNLELYGKCEINDNTIILKTDTDDFVFQRNGTELTEIGSDTLSGTNLKYKKISDLAYINLPAN
ncbi:MAG: hypothetical protein E7520_01990 [Ruminococcaceae bacterium]|nr:hypothetical protein [Oscillospiraceae bacterium]